MHIYTHTIRSLIDAIKFAYNQDLSEAIFHNRLKDINAPIGHLIQNSSLLRKGDIFLAIQGTNRHGGEFIQQAIDQEAAIILFDGSKEKLSSFLKNIPNKGSTVIIAIENLNKNLGNLSSAYEGFPSTSLELVAVTGTNGKTSITFILASLLEAIGKEVSIIGTTGTGTLNSLKGNQNTTPMPNTIQSLFREFLDNKSEYVCFEASSHALIQGRLLGTTLSGAIFTNLTLDHLDFHKTEENYAGAKWRLFSGEGTNFLPKISVFNIDDNYGRKFFKKSIKQTNQSISYAHDTGNSENTDLSFKIISQHKDGTDFSIKSIWGNCTKIRTNLYGVHNIYNIAGAISFLCAKGFNLDLLTNAIDKIRSPRGRLERVISDKLNCNVFVDYAHTPDALKHAILAIKEHSKGYLSVIFGCGGDRDTSKRPIMGKIASEIADEIILTSDNPRNEVPIEIIKQILDGIPMPFRDKVIIQVSRSKAIEFAIKNAKQGSTILIAGKGHETYQEINNERKHFNDIEETLKWV